MQDTAVNHPILLPPCYPACCWHGSLNVGSPISALIMKVVVLNKIDLPHVRSMQEELETSIKAELDHTRFMSIRYAFLFFSPRGGRRQNVTWRLDWRYRKRRIRQNVCLASEHPFCGVVLEEGSCPLAMV